MPKLIAAERDAEDGCTRSRISSRSSPTATRTVRTALLARIDEASRTLDAARGRIRAANPRYAELKHPAALTAAEIQHDLARRERQRARILARRREELSLGRLARHGARVRPAAARDDRHATSAALRDNAARAGDRRATSMPIEQRVAADWPASKRCVWRERARGAMLPAERVR